MVEYRKLRLGLVVLGFGWVHSACAPDPDLGSGGSGTFAASGELLTGESGAHTTTAGTDTGELSSGEVGGSDGGEGSGTGTTTTATTTTGEPNDPSNHALYELVTEAAGIDAPHVTGDAYFVPTGQAWVDLDRDGFLDLVVTRPTLPNLVFENLGNGAFAPVANPGDLAREGQVSGGVAAADYDRDGYPDLFITGQNTPNMLLRNTGGFVFEDRAELAGLGAVGPSTSASWGDYDGDGWLDLYVPNNNFETPDRLYRNLGNGQFEDVSGLLPEEKRLRLGLTSTFFDYDDDGDVDLYILNDKYTGNLLWQNDGPGCGGWCFSDVSATTGAGVEMFSMGLALGDYDRDGDVDMFITNIGSHVLLQSQRSQGSNSYVDVADTAGVLVDDFGWGEYGWGCQFIDVDNDGWLDLYVTMGNYANEPSLGNRLYRNLGNGTFEDVSKDSGANLNDVVFGMAAADYNADGGVDIVLGVVDRGYELLRNRRYLGGENNWLSVELRGGEAVNPDALGARLVVKTTDGAQLRRDLVSGATWGGDYARPQHVGLGTATVESVTITWPDGFVDLREGVAVGQHVVFDYPQP